MKKKILGAVLSLGAIVGLASCMEETHQHEFSKDWSSNAGGHWHACECDDRLHDSFAAHVDADKNGKCDVCTFAVEVHAEPKEEHTHSYAEAWTSNAQGHWHACSCDASLMNSFAAHVDANNDGKCDVCNADVEKQHVHTYATEWSKDATNHWHESTCDHKVVDGKAAHTLGTDGKCTTCGYGAEAENVATLKAIDVNAEAAKVYYNVGDTFSAEGIVVYETYKNTLTADTHSVAADLTGYTISVKDSSGNAVTGAFAAHGVYTVTVAKGEIKDTYEVSVGAKVYNSVADALEAGLANAGKVNSGSVIVDTDFKYAILDYCFGENYFGYTENDLTSDYDYEYHFEKLADNSIFGIKVSNYFDSNSWETTTELSSYYEPTADNMLGVDLIDFFSYNYNVYGVEALVEALYADATAETSQDFKESFSKNCDVCGVHHGYNFEFAAYLGYYFYKVEVSFTLDDATKTINKIEMKVTSSYEGCNIVNKVTVTS